MKPKESEKSNTRKDSVDGQILLSILGLSAQTFQDIICWVFSSLILMILVYWKKDYFHLQS